MKTLYKLIVVAALVFTAANANAQVGVTAGYLRARVSSEGTTGGESGFFAGLALEQPVKSLENFYLEEGLIYTYHGDSASGIKENFHGISIPVHLKYKYYANNTLGIFAYAGPAASVGIAANMKVPSYGTYNLYDESMKRFDVKLGIGGGIELNHKFALRIGYDWGLLNISKVVSNCHLNYLYTGVTIMF